ncbi:hypothetical protein GGR56DRAFT_650634 [Xylariaceae sp. FL0804]|nr:hypothetical protein GGR56DRAFT_650634 [Xylariaceae sp. FL0804]
MCRQTTLDKKVQLLVDRGARATVDGAAGHLGPRGLGSNTSLSLLPLHPTFLALAPLGRVVVVGNGSGSGSRSRRGSRGRSRSRGSGGGGKRSLGREEARAGVVHSDRRLLLPCAIQRDSDWPGTRLVASFDACELEGRAAAGALLLVQLGLTLDPGTDHVGEVLVVRGSTIEGPVRGDVHVPALLHPTDRATRQRAQAGRGLGLGLHAATLVLRLAAVLAAACGAWSDNVSEGSLVLASHCGAGGGAVLVVPVGDSIGVDVGAEDRCDDGGVGRCFPRREIYA